MLGGVEKGLVFKIFDFWERTSGLTLPTGGPVERINDGQAVQ